MRPRQTTRKYSEKKTEKKSLYTLNLTFVRRYFLVQEGAIDTTHGGSTRTLTSNDNHRKPEGGEVGGGKKGQEGGKKENDHTHRINNEG